jgi:predicted DNA-binding transcriptional regulator AlpA
MQLDPDDIEQLADAVADRVAQRLREQPPTRFVDAAALARVLGVKRSWVYEHAGELGAVRLGGPQGRLRFDLATVDERLARQPMDATPGTARRAPRRPRPRAGKQPAPLLPYRAEPRHTITGRGHDQASRRPGSSR